MRRRLFITGSQIYAIGPKKEVIEKAYTLKDLGGVRPTVPSEESTEASSDASAE